MKYLLENIESPTFEKFHFRSWKPIKVRKQEFWILLNYIWIQDNYIHVFIMTFISDLLKYWCHDLKIIKQKLLHVPAIVGAYMHLLHKETRYYETFSTLANHYFFGIFSLHFFDFCSKYYLQTNVYCMAKSSK